MESLNLRIQIPKWIWGSPLQSSQFYSLNSLNKRVPSPINLQHDPTIYSWEVTERLLWIGTKLPINEYNLHHVFLCEAPAPLRFLRNLLCVLNLWFHQDQGGGKKRLDLKKKIFLNKFRYLEMWQKSGQWYPQVWRWVGRSTSTAPAAADEHTPQLSCDGRRKQTFPEQLLCRLQAPFMHHLV